MTTLAIVNARVWTGDPRRPWADAVLLRGDRIEAVGSSAEVRKRAGSARVVDARGMLVAPALVDAHVHDLDGGLAPASAHFRGALAPGMPADVVLIDRDITRMAPEAIRQARVMLTVAAGQVAYDRDGLTR